MKQPLETWADRSWTRPLAPLLLCAFVAPACSKKPAQPTADELLAQMQGCKPPPIEIFLQADAELNPNPRGQSMPVEVRVLLLKQRQAFDQLDFETAWQKAAEELAKDLVDSASTTVFPGQAKIHPMKGAPEVTYVALVALFRQPQGDGWKRVVNVSAHNRRCPDKKEEALHTIVHARLHGVSITEPDASGPARKK